MPDILAHHHDEHAEEDDTRNPERPRCDTDRAADRGAAGEGKEGRTHNRRRGRGYENGTQPDCRKGIEVGQRVRRPERCEGAD